MKDDTTQDGAKPRAERILAALAGIEMQSGKTQGAMNCIWARIDDLECKFGDRFTFIEEQVAPLLLRVNDGDGPGQGLQHLSFRVISPLNLAARIVFVSDTFSV